MGGTIGLSRRRPNGADVAVRPATLADLAAITRIYAFHVVHGTGSWEYEPPDEVEMSARFDGILSAGFPYVVAERAGEVVGYAYASHFHPRIGYRFTCEDSVYVAPLGRRQGVGRALLTSLIEQCTALGLRRMAAVIGDSQNEASIALHRTCGFRLMADAPAIGWKSGRALGWVLMTRDLAPGPIDPPALDIRSEDPGGAVGRALLAGLAIEQRDRPADSDSPTVERALSGAPFLVARLDGQPAGCGMIRMDQGGGAMVPILYTVPWAQEHGVSDALAGALAEEAERRGARLRVSGAGS